MKINRFVGVYFFIVGIGIIGLWLMMFLTNQIPELETEPTAIAFHITIEILMGVLAIVTGYLVWKGIKSSYGFLLFTSGMISYSVINSSGYYGETNNYGMIIMFLVILCATLFSVFSYKKT